MADANPPRHRRRLAIAAALATLLAAAGTAIYLVEAQEEDLLPVVSLSKYDGDPLTFPHISDEAFAQAARPAEPNYPGPMFVPELRVPGDEPLPRVLFVGEDNSVFAAAHRWTLVTALSRFGTFKGLTAASTVAEPEKGFSSFATVSFDDATYSSPYLTFTAYELPYLGLGKTASYDSVDELSSQDRAFLEKHNPHRVAPNTFMSSPVAGLNRLNKSYSVALLGGLTHDDVLAQVRDPDTQVGSEILHSANMFTVAVCEVTDQKPASVCSAPELTPLRTQLHTPLP